MRDFQSDGQKVKIGGKDGLITKFEGNLKQIMAKSIFRSILIAILTIIIFIK